MILYLVLYISYSSLIINHNFYTFYILIYCYYLLVYTLNVKVLIFLFLLLNLYFEIYFDFYKKKICVTFKKKFRIYSFIFYKI